jgi:hypothetical protein
MISEENVKMGNKALADDTGMEGSQGSELDSRLQRLKESLNLDSLRSQAMVLKDKVQQNPKATAGIAALALAGGIWAISRSVSASRRRQRTVTKMLAAVGLWRALTPLLKAMRRKAPKVKKAGAKRFSQAGELLRENAGPFFERTVPRLVKRFSH